MIYDLLEEILNVTWLEESYTTFLNDIYPVQYKMRDRHYAIIAIFAFVVIMVVIVEFPIYRGPNALIVPSKPYLGDASENTDASKNISGCRDPELADLQYHSNGLATRNQVKSIIFANPETRKIIDASTYCEFMGLSTLYTGNGTYQVINTNLNNTKNLVVQVDLRNNTVVSYEIYNLTRGYTAK